jgi:hypothetical protein
MPETGNLGHKTTPVLQTILQDFGVLSFISGGKQRKPPIWNKSLANFILKTTEL